MYPVVVNEVPKSVVHTTKVYPSQTNQATLPHVMNKDSAQIVIDNIPTTLARVEILKMLVVVDVTR